MIKIGNVSLNPEAFKDWTKEQFFEAFTGKLSRDKSEVWKEIVKFNGVEKKDDASTHKPNKKDAKLNG